MILNVFGFLMLPFSSSMYYYAFPLPLVQVLVTLNAVVPTSLYILFNIKLLQFMFILDYSVYDDDDRDMLLTFSI